MNPLIIPLFTEALKLGSEWIADPDKKAEYDTRSSEIDNQFRIALLQTQTNPFVDGAVKLIYGIIGLARPVGSLGIFLIAVFNPDLLNQLHNLGWAGDTGIAAMFGAFPAWGVARQVEKKTTNPFIN